MSDVQDETGSPGESRGDATPAPLGADLIIPALGVALALYFIISTIDLTREARLTGWSFGFLLIALCAVQVAVIAVGVRRGTTTLRLGEIVDNTPHNRRRLALVALLILFIATIGLVGTTLALFLTVLGGLWVMGVRRPPQLFGIAGSVASTVFIVFIVLLGSRLPRGLFEDFALTLLTGQGG